MNDMYLKAEEKLNQEFNIAGYSQKARAVKEAVKKALLIFAKQEKEFAQAIIENPSSLKDCCEHVVKNVGNSISDLKAFKKAVAFYFDGADIEFEMKIYLSPSEKQETHKQSMNISLKDLL